MIIVVYRAPLNVFLYVWNEAFINSFFKQIAQRSDLFRVTQKISGRDVEKQSQSTDLQA